VNALPIVGIASSAGDLAAVAELVSAFSLGYHAALVIVQRVVAGREKFLFDVLAQKTARPLVHVYNDVQALPGHIYLITANTTLTLSESRIRVAPEVGVHHPGDLLFASLAKERGRSAIGIVLSGEGADGALGVQAIQARGGTTVAQYPGSARFPGMPINAIETGCVQFVLRPNEIARECERLAGRNAPAADSSVSYPMIEVVETSTPTHRSNLGHESAGPVTEAFALANP
jgi:two-component system, chemotaxis family, CheB/CheR fusion protein